MQEEHSGRWETAVCARRATALCVVSCPSSCKEQEGPGLVEHPLRAAGRGLRLPVYPRESQD